MKLNEVARDLRASPKRWLVTGAAGFIGSNLTEYLLLNNQQVVGLDNFATGYRRNLDDVCKKVGSLAAGFKFVEADICDMEAVTAAIGGVDYVLHQAALGSVPKSIEDPLKWNRTNVDGFVNVLTAARDAKVRGFVYASSSSVYGDSPELPKVESRIGRPLSPYAVSKLANELYAAVYSSCYGFASVGLRYFNVFGPRQDPNGAYAAVIPKWISSLRAGSACVINGDGKTTRDFCYIENVIQANILSAVCCSQLETGRIFNVGVNERTDLLTLHDLIAEAVRSAAPGIALQPPVFRSFRAGDVRHSLASIDLIKEDLGYVPTHTLKQGLEACVGGYMN